jgi:adenylate kinase family enzyme
MNRVHALVAGLNRSSSYSNKTGLIDMLGLIIEPLIRNLELGHVALLARTCQSLRVLTTNDQLLHFLFQYLPPKNAIETRLVFHVPRGVALQEVAKSRYSQQEAFLYAMKKYQGLEEFRRAVLKRKTVSDKRREKARVRQELARANVRRREELVNNAILVVGLPQTFLQIRVLSIRFIHILPQTTTENEELQLELLVERLCWRYYLHEQTDFLERVKQRIENVGWYPELSSEMEDEFERPEVWPWLE